MVQQPQGDDLSNNPSPRKPKERETNVTSEYLQKMPKKKAKKRVSRANIAGRNRKKRYRRYILDINPIISYFIRLVILGVAMGAIAGSVLSGIKPTNIQLTTEVNQQQTLLNSESNFSPSGNYPSLSFTEEIIPLQEKLTQVAAKYSRLEAGWLFVDVDSGAYVEFHASKAFSAASTIKIPILVAFWEEVDAGKISVDEPLTMTEEMIAGGSGNMRYYSLDTQFSALKTATEMIRISDNTATNMLIERIGGAQAMNQRFREWGLTETVINNPLADLEGTNTTSPQDLVEVLALVNQGELLSLGSRDRFLYIMQTTKVRTLLPAGLGEEATIAHKTGDIGSVLGDAGIITLANGKRYLAAVIVKRPHNDYSAKTLIQELSRTVYQYFKDKQ